MSPIPANHFKRLLFLKIIKINESCDGIPVAVNVNSACRVSMFITFGNYLFEFSELKPRFIYVR